jgi:hypothetical protein
MSAPPGIPDAVTRAKEALHRALWLLEQPEDPEAIEAARDEVQLALDAIPYPWTENAVVAKAMELSDTVGSFVTRGAIVATSEPLQALSEIGAAISNLGGPVADLCALAGQQQPQRAESLKKVAKRVESAGLLVSRASENR